MPHDKVHPTCAWQEGLLTESLLPCVCVGLSGSSFLSLWNASITHVNGVWSIERSILVSEDCHCQLPARTIDSTWLPVCCTWWNGDKCPACWRHPLLSSIGKRNQVAMSLYWCTCCC